MNMRPTDVVEASNAAEAPVSMLEFVRLQNSEPMAISDPEAEMVAGAKFIGILVFAVALVFLAISWRPWADQPTAIMGEAVKKQQYLVDNRP